MAYLIYTASIPMITFYEFVLLNAMRICFILDFPEAVDIKWGDFLSDSSDFGVKRSSPLKNSFNHNHKTLVDAMFDIEETRFLPATVK